MGWKILANLITRTWPRKALITFYSVALSQSTQDACKIRTNRFYYGVMHQKDAKTEMQAVKTKISLLQVFTIPFARAYQWSKTLDITI